MGDTATSRKPAARTASLKMLLPNRTHRERRARTGSVQLYGRCLMSVLLYSLAAAQKQISWFSPTQCFPGADGEMGAQEKLCPCSAVWTFEYCDTGNRSWSGLSPVSWMTWILGQDVQAFFGVLFHTLLWQSEGQRRVWRHLCFCGLGAWQLPPSLLVNRRCRFPCASAAQMLSIPSTEVSLACRSQPFPAGTS